MPESKEPVQMNIEFPPKKEEKAEPESSRRVVLEHIAARSGLNETSDVEVYKSKGEWYLETETAVKKLDPDNEADQHMIDEARKKLGW